MLQLCKKDPGKFPATMIPLQTLKKHIPRIFAYPIHILCNPRPNIAELNSLNADWHANAAKINETILATKMSVNCDTEKLQGIVR